MMHEISIDELTSEAFRRFRLYWEDVRAGRLAPAWEDVDLIALGGEIVPYLTVVDVHEDPRDFIYRYWGTGHTNIKGRDNTGASVLNHEPLSLGELIWQEYDLVVREKRPAAFRREVMIKNGTAPKTQNVLRLPLSRDGETVSHVISFADWETNSGAWKKFFDSSENS